MKRAIAAILAAILGISLSSQTPTFFDLTGLAPQVVNFTTEAAAQDLAKTRKVVYFFAADWCPDCQADLAAFRQSRSEIPEGVTLIVVNYDEADDLRVKYQVPAQDVYVQIDSQGQRKLAWLGGGVAALKKRVKP